MGKAMKIYNMVRYDKDFNIIEEDSFEYSGPLALAEGEGGEGGEGDPGGGEPAAPVPFTLGDTLPTDMMGADGSFPKSLQDFTGVVIPGADKDNADHQQFHSKISSLMKSHADTKSMVGGMIKIPGEDSSKEEISAYREKLGIPATPGDYTAKMADDLNSGILISEDNLVKFKEQAHEKGYTNDHVQFALDFQTQMFSEQIKEMDTKAADGMATLQTELGDKYDVKMKGAEMMVQKYFPEAAQKTISAALGNDPDFVRGMMAVFDATAEDGDLLGEGQDQKDLSAKALESEINELLASEKYGKGDAFTHNKVSDLITRKQKLLGTYEENVVSSKK